jgi:transmembrane sensor
MSHDRPEISALAEEAAHWLIELEDANDATLQRFAAWLETSPRHVEEFLLIAAVWKEFDQLDMARRLDIERLLDEARNNVRSLARHETDVPPLPARSAPHRTLLRRTATAAAAAVAVLAVALAFWLLPATQPRAYATARGEQRAIKLEDGSIVYLNTESRVELRFTKNERLVRLLEGEALFAVEHDPARPFRVLAGPTVIQAVGTRFNVYRSDSGATVSVVEGVVQISPEASASASAGSPATNVPSTTAPATQPDRARLSAGEQARVAPDGEIVKRSLPDLAQVVAWRERRLVFRAEPLEHVAAEFNRYNAVQIHVEGDDLRARQITGVFDADDPRSFIQFLQRDSTLAVQDSDDEISIRPL